MRRLALPLLTLPLLAVPACDVAETEADPIGSVVPAGKADDFFSRTAQEYEVEGRATITLDASWDSATEEARLAEVRRLLPFKQVVVGWFLNAYLVDKSSHDSNKDYGGLKGLTKNGSYEDGDLAAVAGQPLTYAFTFRQEFGGHLDLLAQLDGARVVDAQTYEFDLWVGKISNTDMQQLETDHEWYRRSPWSAFDPAKVSDDQKEIQLLTVRPQPPTEDAWIDYQRLFADGALSVGIHFGWDYHGAYHEKHSKAVYQWLIGKGFRSPVASWDELRHDAGPLTGEITWQDRSIAVEVSLFWGRAGDATDPDTAAGGKQLEDDMLTSLAHREVAIYSGHSGPFYGFALANWRKTSEGDLDDSELAVVPLMEGAYQVIVAEGCDTYAVGQAFYLNPTKEGLQDLDVLTTTSFSNASTAGTVLDILTALMGTRYSAEVQPKTYGELLRELDGNSSWFTTMYGVHGVDDNPTVHPFADLAMSCAPCAGHADCGDGARCARMQDDVKACGAICTATRSCPEGYDCRNVQVGGTLDYRLCVPASLICGAPVVDPPRLAFNEVYASPSTEDYGDANGDGVRDATDDEFVEILNTGAADADLAGWTLADGVMSRHVFATGTVLAPGGALVVFGGGAPQLAAGTALVQTASTGGLGLNNRGDAVRLLDPDGNVAVEMSYGAEGGDGLAMVRETDADPEALWIVAVPTPGTRSDGTNF